MRLWHQDLIKLLPDQQLRGQHSEICGMRGNGWGRKHKTVDYVFRHSPYMLFEFHVLVMREMIKRGYKNVDRNWFYPLHRGQNCLPYDSVADMEYELHCDKIYKEHNEEYLKECLDNLRTKGIELNILKVS